MTYEDVRGIVGVAGMLLFIILFAGVLIYTFWPGNKKRFERARHIPLEDDPDVDTRSRKTPEDKSSSRGANGHQERN
jgi:cytochrome c oxidase cbb3-type subunit 4